MVLEDLDSATEALPESQLMQTFQNLSDLWIEQSRIGQVGVIGEIAEVQTPPKTVLVSEQTARVGYPSHRLFARMMNQI